MKRIGHSAMPRKIKPSYGLNRLRKYFPNIKTVSDSHKRVEVEVLEKDCKGGIKGSVASCALARAFCREHKVNGALIGLTHSYLIKGSHATRFRTPTTVAREVVTFDRHKDFDTGKYHLSAISPSQGFNRPRQRNTGKSHRETGAGHTPHRIIHTTARVRKGPLAR